MATTRVTINVCPPRYRSSINAHNSVTLSVAQTWFLNRGSQSYANNLLLIVETGEVQAPAEASFILDPHLPAPDTVRDHLGPGGFI